MLLESVASERYLLLGEEKGGGGSDNYSAVCGAGAGAGAAHTGQTVVWRANIKGSRGRTQKLYGW